MRPRRKRNASSKGGAHLKTLGGGTRNQKEVFDCSANHISEVISELIENGVALQGVLGETQIKTLRKALEFRGPKGLNTFEGTAAGYARLATRIQNLEEDGWLIHSHRENVIGPDGFYHAGIARYVLVGRQAGTPVQSDLGLEDACKCQA